MNSFSYLPGATIPSPPPPSAYSSNFNSSGGQTFRWNCWSPPRRRNPSTHAPDLPLERMEIQADMVNEDGIPLQPPKSRCITLVIDVLQEGATDALNRISIDLWKEILREELDYSDDCSITYASEGYSTIMITLDLIPQHVHQRRRLEPADDILPAERGFTGQACRTLLPLHPHNLACQPGHSAHLH